MDVIGSTGAIVAEPDWESTFSDVLDVVSAREHWRVLTNELREANTLSPANAHALRRLVNAYVIYDQLARQVTENGAVATPKRGNKTAIARISPYFSGMREVANDATNLEAELGISPRRRGAVTKVSNAKKAPRAADAYLKPRAV